MVVVVVVVCLWTLEIYWWLFYDVLSVFSRWRSTNDSVTVIVYVVVGMALQAVYHMFIPSERCIPKIRIQTRQVDELVSKRIVVAIDCWRKESLYPQVPAAWCDVAAWICNNNSNSTSILSLNTHTHLTALFSGTTRVSQYQEGFYWSKKEWVAVASAGPYASLHLAPDR